MTEPEQLLKLIDGHIEVMSEGIDFNKGVADSTRAYFAGMKSIRWLVYNFLNSPRPAGEPSSLTEEELKLIIPEEE